MDRLLRSSALRNGLLWRATALVMALPGPINAVSPPAEATEATVATAAHPSLVTPPTDTAAPPPAYPGVTRDGYHRRSGALAQAGTKLYSIGDPTAEEQLYLELVNRARADPAAEGIRLRDTTDADVQGSIRSFKVDLDLMVSQFAAITPAPPLSMNEKLLQAARKHTQDMLENGFQRHDGSDGRFFDERVADEGYDWQAVGENVFSFARSVFHGHAGFQVDWGRGPASVGGMQNPPGHRISIHSPNYREVGIGVIVGSTELVGPQLVTQNFATPVVETPFITGVAFLDLNGNAFYDLGEGVGGVRVTVEGAEYFAVTSSSGGYSIPVPGDGTYSATFSLDRFDDRRVDVDVSVGENVKVDYRLEYSAPTLTGPVPAEVGLVNSYSFTPVPGAGRYQWRKVEFLPYTAVENAEEGPTQLIPNISPGYSLLDTEVFAEGSRSFHLAHVDEEPQVLAFDSIFLLQANSELRFRSRLGFATPIQAGRVQVSTDGGGSWQTVWQQVGTGDLGETSFRQNVVDLGGYAGERVMVRLTYELIGHSSYANQAVPGVGFYLDDIRLINSHTFGSDTITDAGSNLSFDITPAHEAEYFLSVRAEVAGRFVDWGPELRVPAKRLPLRVTISKVERTNGLISLEFDTVNDLGITDFSLEGSSDLAGPWFSESLAVLEQLGESGRYRFRVPIGRTNIRFFRVNATRPEL